MALIRVAGAVCVLALLAATAGAARAPLGTIAFSERFYYASDSWEIFVVGANGSARRRLTRLEPWSDDISPAWSPDGHWLAYAALNGARGRTGIWVIDAKGRNLRQLTRRPQGEDRDPTWSPDGRTVAFTRRNDLWTMRSDGRDQQLVLRDAADADWSPDGRQFVFVRGGDGIWLVGSAGGRPRRLTGGWSPDWSPDGKKLAFDDDAVFTIRADGSGRRRIADGREPTWSPDGRRIAYHGVRGIYVSNADGSNPRKIVRAYPETGGPVWGRG